MVGNKIGLSNEFIIHPGETLKEVLEERNYTQKELALRTGFSEKHISKVLSGDNNISPSFAKQLEYALGITSSFWNNLQRIYDEEITEFETQTNITKEEKKIAKKYEFFLEVERIEYKTEQEKIINLRKYMGVSNLVNANQLIHGNYRTQFDTEVDDYTRYGFDVYSKRAVEHLKSENDLNIKGLKTSLPILKAIMMRNADEYVELLQKEFIKYGILFNLVKAIPKEKKIKGYTTSNKDGQAILIITDSGKYWHMFWFTLFHEISHIINKDYLKKNLTDEELEKIEERANRFAEDVLIDRKTYEDFVLMRNFDLRSLFEFSTKENIPLDILIGRLQKYNHMGYTEYTSNFRKISLNI